jgi:hypothetical protein
VTESTSNYLVNNTSSVSGSHVAIPVFSPAPETILPHKREIDDDDKYKKESQISNLKLGSPRRIITYLVLFCVIGYAFVTFFDG